MLLLATVSCRQNNMVTVSGTIEPGDYDTFQLFLRDGEEQTAIETDSTGVAFSVVVPCDTIHVVYLAGVVGSGDEAWPYEQALLFEPGKEIRLNLLMGNRKMTVTAGEKDRDNRALIAYKTYETTMRRDLWENTPHPDHCQKALDEIMGRVKEIEKELNPSETVKKYLSIQGYLVYRQSISDLRHIYRMDKMGEVPETVDQRIPASNKVLDDPMALLFYNTGTVIITDLKKQGKSPEEQIRVLKETYSHAPLVEQVTRMILQNYIIEYDYAVRFDEGLARLRAMASGLNDGGSQLVKQFESKKYSVVGAALPPARVEDVDGNVYQISDFKGKNLYIDLWASWCVPCCQEVPFLQKLEKQVKNPAVRFVSISLDKDKSAWKSRMKELDMHGEQYIVVGDELVTMLNVVEIPHFLIYDKVGRLVQYKAERPSSGEPLKKMLHLLR